MARKGEPNSPPRTPNDRAVARLQRDTTIDLGQGQVLDGSGLTESQIQELKAEFIRGRIDIQKKAGELRVDVEALDALLSSFNDQTARATDASTHTTITHTQTTAVGRTEVVVGNTDRAAKAKLSSSAKGETDIKLPVIIILAVTAIVIAIVLGVR